MFKQLRRIAISFILFVFKNYLMYTCPSNNYYNWSIYCNLWIESKRLIDRDEKQRPVRALTFTRTIDRHQMIHETDFTRGRQLSIGRFLPEPLLLKG